VAEVKQVLVPDIGDFKNIPVVELLVKPGDAVKKEEPLISLESDKATMEVPSPFAGIVKEINVLEGDRVSEGALILEMEVNQTDSLVEVSPSSNQVSSPDAPVENISSPDRVISSQPDTKPSTLIQLSEAALTMAHASPSVRRFARELGVNLNLVSGSGKKKRILKDDVKAYVKAEISKSPGSGNDLELNLLPWPKVDFAKFGPVKLKPLLRIQKLSGANLHRNWVMIPHVTQFDEADITDLEVERNKSNESKPKDGAKLTILAFLIEAAVAALKEFPDFNASLDRESGDINLVIKNYYHIGFAVDTSHGLMVPVIRDADQKNIVATAKEMGDLAERAREGKLKPAEMQGASFTISSLGGIGGTAFTPIINAPEVAILGASRANIKPVYRDGQFVPRLILPLSLSYDHRVIDGASAARFTAYIVKELANMSQVFL
jgi:pyruvate dehydrogenase E2 component (dihydrolipoyllysine-residue acetyltransferase)